MNEAEIVRRILKVLNALPHVYAIRTHGGAFQQKGTPDILGSAYGHCFIIEAKKSAREQPSDAQLYNIKKFKEADAATFVGFDPKAREVLEWISTLST